MPAARPCPTAARRPPAVPGPAVPRPAVVGPAAPGAGVPAASRDVQRARVYRAEDAWAARLDAARRGAPLARIAGSDVLLPAERRFGDLGVSAAYLSAVLALPDVAGAFGVLAPPLLRRRRGLRAAHWEAPGTIAVPVPARGEPWAMRETVLLHELAHHVGHLTGLARSHAPPFPAVVLALVAGVLGEQAAFALRVDYGEERVQVGVL